MQWEDPYDPWQLALDPKTNRKYFYHNVTHEMHWFEDREGLPVSGAADSKKKRKKKKGKKNKIQGAIQRSGIEMQSYENPMRTANFV